MIILPIFKNIIVVDFEFISKPGERPEPICLVFHEIYSGKTEKVWLQGKDLSSLEPPYPMSNNDLFIAFYSSSEWGCHMVLNWGMPINVLDLYVEFKCRTNGLPGISKGLLGACNFYGINTISQFKKDEAGDRILQGPPFTDLEKKYILDYCASDVFETAELFKKMFPRDDSDISSALYRGKFMEVVATMEYNGIPIDMEMLEKLRDNWDKIKEYLIQNANEKYSVFEGLTFKMSKFEKYLLENKIPWPRTPKGRLETKESTLKEMCMRYPQLQLLRDTKDYLSQLNLSKLTVGSDGRNRCMLSPFASKTSRNQPSNSKYIFGPAVWLRSLIKPEPGMGLAYIDYEQQEFGIAAYLSKDQKMIDAYNSGDPYLTFAKLVKKAPEKATKESHGEIRDLFKLSVLGLQYRMGVESLAIRIGEPAHVAKEMIEFHEKTFKKCHLWEEDLINKATWLKKMETKFGWNLHTIGTESKLQRTIVNFPCQATGAEMLRVACIKIWEKGIKIIGPIHDAILIEYPSEKEEETLCIAQKLMEDAGRIVLGPEIKIRTDAKVIRYPDRYIDKRGVETWNKIIDTLELIENRSA